ncbi:hypothetical protein [Pedobacter antarcticus]|uniref:hypothetical protein n=1 Tax=Pedobacter antarcticus TaxID=34086 RepID=UPI000886DEDF|nr:hypothetical protein [Pedobacter antarcticus]SDM82501.1 hypothetical protein SAMN04488084_1154 [Pedobacter antarcticus]
MDEEKYVFEIEHFGRLEMKGESVFKALETLKNELSPDIQFKILKAHVIKNDDFLIDISELVATV